MDNWKIRLQQANKESFQIVESLMEQSESPISEANLPEQIGIYAFVVHGEVKYIGEARGSRGLRDRITKHLSGDESHAVQRAYKQQYPDRQARRDFIKRNVYVKWVVMPDQDMVSWIERVLIWLFHPPWNQK